MRIALVGLALLAGCNGGGGGGPAASPADPNPAPATAPLTSIDMAGAWEVIIRNVVNANTAVAGGLEVGVVAEIVTTGTGFIVNATNPPASVYRQDIETQLGFALDWYQNAGNGAALEFGYGWDRLRTQGGGGAFRDYTQYGARVVAVGPDMLSGYEAEWTQDFLGQPRFEWLAQVTLRRQ